ncbi:MAG: tRNA1(Val) (adenine(37)-N6)-methyltransferase [Mycoplasmataceae bacterium]|nr:tRNA1(Val) (adenine(37)-N6)-methyltransferase [Mycoplasmataceae bacterium]
MGNIVKNSLGYDSDIYVYQDKDMFNYSVDTILLANFVSVNSSTKNVLEIGANNGALSIFVSERKKGMSISALEIQDAAIPILEKNINFNNKQDDIEIVHKDFNDFYKEHAANQMNKFDTIICNPPFYKVDSTIKRKGSEELYIATHEVKLNLEQLIMGSAKIIKQKGHLAMVLPTERLVDAFEYLRKYKFEPKRIKFIHPRINTKSNLVLIESRFQVGWGTKFLPNLYLHTEDIDKHEYTEQVIKEYKPRKYIKGEHNE